MSNKGMKQPIIGWILLILSLIFAGSLDNGVHVLFGLALGYSLMRAYTGFAGSINRAYRRGSTKLLRAMLGMFFITAVLMAGVLYTAEPGSIKLNLNPINFGLILGGLFFGFGMSLASCCASGALTDLVNGTPRAFVVLIFFMIGVFFGFPFQHKATWCTTGWFTSANGGRGVFIPDWFPNGHFGGYLGALIVTGIFCLIGCWFAFYYEKKKRDNGEYLGVPSEIKSEEKDNFDWKDAKFFSWETYYHIFAKPWTLMQGSVALSVIFTVMTLIQRKGWGVSSAYGIWFGKLLVKFGYDPAALADFAGFTGKKADIFAKGFLAHNGSVQDVFIIVGTLIYLLMANHFVAEFKDGLAEWDKRDALMYAVAGFSMGFGTRLGNGCNVGALYTPIAEFSLSGWIYIIFLFTGAFIGNRVVKGHNCRKCAK